MIGNFSINVGTVAESDLKKIYISDKTANKNLWKLPIDRFSESDMKKKSMEHKR